ncbi:MAG: 4-(cytidine 5'-diphospho)-2-C-methyl-D-erythritol kinase [Candidatus Omnitrophica bacterium]|nr:4-(cytidine 5'-diphospho)-2-C-methyl-D-erythritol kinase [Candidatus Omnitrophota bacterium]
MSSLTLKSPAKLNLYLNVLRKRADGYHDIETLFERIDLADRVTLTKIPSGIRLTSNCKDIPLDASNLAYQAAQKMLQKRRKGSGVHIHLHKRIPIAAGLGGGSSNAATVLLGLNRLFHLRLSQKVLLAIGRTLGSDVPFFLLKTPFAIGKRRGDRVTPVSGPLKLIHLIVNNRVKVYTTEVYQQANFTLTRRRQGVKIFQHFVERGDVTGLIDNCYNALEAPAARAHPTILKVKKRLKALGLKGVTLSGSGPTFYGFAKSLSQAKGIRKILSKSRWNVFICRTY